MHSTAAGADPSLLQQALDWAVAQACQEIPSTPIALLDVRGGEDWQIDGHCLTVPWPAIAVALTQPTAEDLSRQLLAASIQVLARWRGHAGAQSVPRLPHLQWHAPAPAEAATIASALDLQAVEQLPADWRERWQAAQERRTRPDAGIRWTQLQCQARAAGPWEPAVEHAILDYLLETASPALAHWLALRPTPAMSEESVFACQTQEHLGLLLQAGAPTHGRRWGASLLLHTALQKPALVPVLLEAGVQPDSTETAALHEALVCSPNGAPKDIAERREMAAHLRSCLPPSPWASSDGQRRALGAVARGLRPGRTDLHLLIAALPALRELPWATVRRQDLLSLDLLPGPELQKTEAGSNLLTHVCAKAILRHLEAGMTRAEAMEKTRQLQALGLDFAGWRNPTTQGTLFHSLVRACKQPLVLPDLFFVFDAVGVDWQALDIDRRNPLNQRAWKTHPEMDIKRKRLLAQVEPIEACLRERHLRARLESLAPPATEEPPKRVRF